MTFEEIEAIINTAVKSLYENQKDIFKSTAQTGQTEWNLTHHLANELHKFLPQWDCDIDVTKHEHGNMRPDIIFYKRGTDNNFLVIEAKYRRDEKAVASDIEKIQGEWFRGRLKYKFGASVNLFDGNRTDIRLLQNNK